MLSGWQFKLKLNNGIYQTCRLKYRMREIWRVCILDCLRGLPRSRKLLQMTCSRRFRQAVLPINVLRHLPFFQTVTSCPCCRQQLLFNRLSAALAPSIHLYNPCIQQGVLVICPGTHTEGYKSHINTCTYMYTKSWQEISIFNI